MTVATSSTQVVGTWVQIGVAGPQLLQAIEGALYIEIADSQPATGPSGFVLKPEHGPRDFNTASSIWALAAGFGTKATVVSAPVTA